MFLRSSRSKPSGSASAEAEASFLRRPNIRCQRAPRSGVFYPALQWRMAFRSRRHQRISKGPFQPSRSRPRSSAHSDAGDVAKERFRRASSLGPGLPPLDTDKGSKAKVTPDPA